MGSLIEKGLPFDIQQNMLHYRECLISAGMQEPVKWEFSEKGGRFYKEMTPLTAFIVNLKANEYYIEVIYGYSSTAFTRMAGCEESLQNWGVGDDDITIRETVLICDEAEEEAACQQIREMYERYQDTQKDELLAFAKEKRKAFIQQIAAALKPMGFKKKANTWTRNLELDYYVMFNAQKSAFSDEYYFNVYIGKHGTGEYGDCYYTRIAPGERYPLDWQALSREEFQFFLDRSAVPALKKIIGTPLTELGKEPWVWSGCGCERKKCQKCWVEKNLWGSR